ncbi:methyltransferase [Actinotalea sp. K2]|uniref:DUF7059 domain-containing protein n=1 Tax=Actinotalea sp. K2 TaxID=2939438 RepID=UPI00201705C1|nr:methyltransferase [Actinotalea sp. K2]MCL3861384.1 methyltransferase [Actinotalea sp. K2]
MTPGAPGAVPLTELPLVESLRADLDRSGLTVEAVEGLLGPVASAALHREQRLPALREVDRAAGTGSHAVATLVRLFVLGGEVTRVALDAALPGTGTQGCAQLGLVGAAGQGRADAVRARVDLRPYAAADAAGSVNWWLTSDLGELATGAAVHPDHVLGVGGASTTLAQVTVRDRRRRTLDLGTGCGIQALHATRHSDLVVATDISRRALAFTAFNAALAGLDGPGLDLRRGSMLEPVTGPLDEPFDLVVSNPPFVITPRGGPGGAADSPGVPHFEYRDGGRAGDDLVRDLVQGMGRVLAPGGVAQLLGNWEHRRGEDWRERVGSWAQASGLDAWVVQRDVQDPAEYAETWLRDGGTTAERDPAGWEAGYLAWLDDFAARGVEAVGFGFVLLRRPSTGRATLRRVEEVTGPVRQPLGAHLAAALAGHDWLEARDDDALGAARLVVAADVTEERYLVPGAGDPSVVLLRQGEGFGRAVQAGTALAGLVGACDGELAVGQIVAGVAAILDVPVVELRSELLPQVRDLVRDGLLRPDTGVSSLPDPGPSSLTVGG